MGLAMNAVFFCNLTSCNLVDNYQRFGRKYVHHWEDVYGIMASHARGQQYLCFSFSGF
jgi:hypothetical protein